MRGTAVASGKEGGAPGRGLSTEVRRLTGRLRPCPCVWPDLGGSQSSFRLPLPADPQKPLCGWKDVLIFQMWKLRPSWGNRYPLDVQTARAKTRPDGRCNSKLCTARLTGPLGRAYGGFPSVVWNVSFMARSPSASALGGHGLLPC